MTQQVLISNKLCRTSDLRSHGDPVSRHPKMGTAVVADPRSSHPWATHVAQLFRYPIGMCVSKAAGGPVLTEWLWSQSVTAGRVG